mmetsp:Transcript_7286/g.22195  ORF Transcript_7286/g.22195 Transcript_7286/m.22195 type:complete len:346 (-) Transcript_7286:1284-2321(-)
MARKAGLNGLATACRGPSHARKRALLAVVSLIVLAVVADEIVRESLGRLLRRRPTSQRTQEYQQPKTTVREGSRRYCNESVAHFRGAMSAECSALWRSGLPSRNAPRSFNFLHIPKAGTSFTTSLRNFMDSCPTKDVACPHHSIKDEDLWCHRELIACNGHHHFEDKHLKRYVQSPQRGRAYVTMLRDPARRLVSAKNHDCHRHSGGHRIRPLQKDCSEYTYQEFADLEFIQNCQTKMLTKYFCAGSVDPRKLSVDAAKINLMNLDFFGITDEWETSVRMFHCQFGGELRASEMLNSRPGAYDDMDGKVLDYLRDAEKMDVQLYEYAVDLFHRRRECLQCSMDCI